ncbi:hypothetical protein J2X20_005528 [Pelomonas saccharophila]|uniref:Uncharacterized protein n=1 Tax=Roseateles saccharophilus TaxID=304 RepID=A0ABU1YVG7_ROSSA|nr:hypothetical protein [Roseateles saccharophilus]MDR7272843.1 hypothetical protein [Roseateles saccharophilus]
MNIKDLAMGAAAGAAVAVVTTHYFSDVVAPAPVLGVYVAAPAASAAAPSPAAAASSAASASPGSASAAAPAATAAVPAVACTPALAAAEPRKAASAAAPAALATVRVDVPAVALSEEHAKMLLDLNERPPSLPELHARFAGEPLDAAWSQQMEAQLRQALQDAGVQKGFELLAVECRRTLCELRLFGTGSDAGQRWGGTMGKLAQQPWWGPNFSGVSSSTTGPDDRSVIATILHRAKR